MTGAFPEPMRDDGREPARASAQHAVPPPVSVVVPVRDEPAALAEALASVLAQDYGAAIEIVVADGSRGRETGDLVRARFPGVRLVANPGGGTSAGLNRALAAASHEVIVRCDAHCVLPPDYVRAAVAALARTGAAVVGGMQRPVGTTPFTRSVALAMSTPLGAGDARYRLGGPEGPADTVYLGVFRRDAIEGAGGFDETLARNQDYELNWRLRARGETVWFTPVLSVAYRPRRRLAALARQYFAYGWWKRVVLARHPCSWRWRHLAAPLLTMALAASAMLGAAALPLAYALALGAAAVTLAVRRRAGAALLLPPVLAVMHLAWGAGFWCAWASDLGPGQERTAGPAADAMAWDGYKRLFDLTLVGLALVLLAPLWAVLGLTIALAIRLEDGAPVLYRQARLGRGGRVFEILKFRTMVGGAEAASGPVWAAPGDRRVTRVGRLLRPLRLDELPQVVNILRGDMSLVGPRPERPELAARFERAVPGFSSRLRVRPGVAGLAQAVGAYHWAPGRKLHYDNLYIATMNPWLDLRLCLRCLAKLLVPGRRRDGNRTGDRDNGDSRRADAQPCPDARTQAADGVPAQTREAPE